MAEVKITVRAVPDIASAQAAAQQMSQAAQAAGGNQFNVRMRAAPGGLPPINLPPELRRAEQEAKRINQDRQKMVQGLSFLASPVSNPTSLWGNLLSGVAMQRALSTKQGQRILGQVGMAGTGGTALATASIIGVAAAVGLALKTLQKVIHETAASIQRATKLYIFKGVSGFSDTYASQRMTAADILGVSTDEVMKFGEAMSFLNPQLKQANDNFASSYRRLTLVNWNFKILGTNFESLFTTMATQAAPALNKMAGALSAIVTTVDKLIQNNPKLFQLAMAAMVGPGFALGMNGPAGEAPVGPAGQVPKRSSAWERMGLVVGGPMGSDRTNELLRAQVRLLGRIHAAIKGTIPRGAQPLNQHYTPNLPRA